MASASLRNGSGPGSSLALSAETVRVRNKVIEAFIDKPLSELTGFLQTALESEPDEETRLGMIAARVYILRHRIDNVRQYNKDATIEPLQEPTPRSMLRPHSDTEQNTPRTDAEDEATEDTTTSWQDVEIIEAGEINGVRIPAGISITVDDEDAERLISSGKAVLKTDDAQSDSAPNETTDASQTKEPEAVETNPEPSEPAVQAEHVDTPPSEPEEPAPSSSEDAGEGVVEDAGATAASDDNVSAQPTAETQGTQSS